MNWTENLEVRENNLWVENGGQRILNTLGKQRAEKESEKESERSAGELTQTQSVWGLTIVYFAASTGFQLSCSALGIN